MTTSIVALDAKKPFTDEEIALFEQKYLSACQQLADAVKQKKLIEDQEKKVKEQLEKVMDEYGIKSLENDFIKFTRVAENPGKQTIDIDKMKKEEPNLYDELLEDYPKVTGKKKAYVMFKVKEG